MDRVGFKGLVINSMVFKGWSKADNFANAMDEAERIVEKVQAQLTSKGQPISNDRYQALQDALKVHANARRYDQATKIVDQFDTWAKGKGYNVKLGDEISRPPVPPYRKIDSEATVQENSLAGDKADEVRNWVATQNAAGQSKSHVAAISTASDMAKKFAAACGKK
jgi:hypothetical protein